MSFNTITINPNTLRVVVPNNAINTESDNLNLIVLFVKIRMTATSQKETNVPAQVDKIFLCSVSSLYL